MQLTLSNQKNGNLEIHVPRQFTPEEPAVTFSREVLATSVGTHPLGKRLPALTDYCAVRQFSSDPRDFAGIPNPPKSVEEMMKRNATLLHLHITCFSDATVVGITWPHVVMDAMGLRALLRNWSLVLNNKAGDVLPLVGVQYDPLQELLRQDTGPTEESVLERLGIGLLGTGVMLLRIIWMMLWNPGFEQRTIILPQDSMDRLCVQARSDVITQSGKEPFISEADVLAAWAARILAASQPRPRPVTIASVINLRFTLSALRERGGEYIQNMLQFVYVSIAPGCTVAPLGLIALSHRQQLAEQCTKSQTLSYIRMQQDHTKAKGKLRLLFGDPRAAILTVNNLAKLDFFRNIDFSAAVVRRDEPDIDLGAGTRRNPPGTIVFYHPLVLNERSVLTSYLGVLGKDHTGRTLITGTFQPKTWETIFQDLGSEIQ